MVWTLKKKQATSQSYIRGFDGRDKKERETCQEMERRYFRMVWRSQYRRVRQKDEQQKSLEKTLPRSLRQRRTRLERVHFIKQFMICFNQVKSQLQGQSAISSLLFIMLQINVMLTMHAWITTHKFCLENCIDKQTLAFKEFYWKKMSNTC